MDAKKLAEIQARCAKRVISMTDNITWEKYSVFDDMRALINEVKRLQAKEA